MLLFCLVPLIQFSASCMKSSLHPLGGGGCVVGCAAFGRTMLQPLGLAKLGLFPVLATSDECEL